MDGAFLVMDPDFLEQEDKYLAELIEAGEEFDYKIPNIRIVLMHASLFQDSKKMEMAKKYLNKYRKFTNYLSISNIF